MPTWLILLPDLFDTVFILLRNGSARRDSILTYFKVSRGMPILWARHFVQPDCSQVIQLQNAMAWFFAWRWISVTLPIPRSSIHCVSSWGAWQSKRALDKWRWKTMLWRSAFTLPIGFEVVVFFIFLCDTPALVHWRGQNIKFHVISNHRLTNC